MAAETKKYSYNPPINGRESLVDFEQNFKFGLSQIIIPEIHGPCGGVNMAIDAADQTLDIFEQYNAGKQEQDKRYLWTNHDIIHNKPEMERLKKRGLRNLEEYWMETRKFVPKDPGELWSIVPNGSVALWSAHGVPEAYQQIAALKGLTIINTTCPIVETEHRNVRRDEAEGYRIAFIGSQNHQEVLGTIGHVIDPDNIVLIKDEQDAQDFAKSLGPEEKGRVRVQTTLVKRTIDNLKMILSQNPNIDVPLKDVCYATDNRQDILRLAIQHGIETGEPVDLVLVVGSKNSSNTQSLVKEAKAAGVRSTSINTARDIKPIWFAETDKGPVKRVLVHASASAMENYTQEVIDYLVMKSADAIVTTYQDPGVQEKKITFRLPQSSIDAVKTSLLNPAA